MPVFLSLWPSAGSCIFVACPCYWTWISSYRRCSFERATGNAPFDVAPAFAANQTKIDKNTTYDFVTTNDIIGGNSGSPVIDRAGTVIGAAFDGNIHSLGGNYGYDGTLNRTVAVSAAAVQEALETIYPAPALVEELARH